MLWLTRLVYIMLVVSQSIADDIANALREPPVVTQACDKWYPTCSISILFMAIFMAWKYDMCLYVSWQVQILYHCLPFISHQFPWRFMKLSLKTFEYHLL